MPQAAEKIDAPNLILTGFMGTGKSTLGRLLAQLWHYRFCDTDKIIQKKTGRSIPEIFASDGEAAFRELEKQCIAEWIPESRAVISTGGGIVTIPGIADQLRARGIVVALFASPQVIFQRTSTNKNRPLLQTDGDPLERIRTLLADREQAYMNSGINILTDGRSLNELVAIISRIYRRSARERAQLIRQNITAA